MAKPKQKFTVVSYCSKCNNGMVSFVETPSKDLARQVVRLNNPLCKLMITAVFRGYLTSEKNDSFCRIKDIPLPKEVV